MSNALYEKGREGFLDGSIDWDTHAIKVTLVDGGDYTPNLVTHDNYDDVTPAGRVAVSPSLASKTATDGVADAADTVFTAVTGDPSEYLVGWKDTGVESTSRLIFFIDTATGLPVTPNSGDISIIWNNGANRIFKL